MDFICKKKVLVSSFSLNYYCQAWNPFIQCYSSTVLLQSGHQPAVLVWDCMTLTFISELKCHQYGVSSIAFSPDGWFELLNWPFIPIFLVLLVTII